jgi:Spy/CpxP family protein refolding chaperone
MKHPLHFLAVAVIAISLHSPALSAQSNYSGQEQRSIKALSPEDVQGLREGKGMGLAKAAELNGYPGPSHVLQLSDALSLSSQQRQKTQALFQAMEEKAKSLGAALVEAERELDALFSRRLATPELVQSQMLKIGNLQALVRSAHLEVHIAQAALLTPEQITQYEKLRGYTTQSESGTPAPSHRH